MAIPAWAAGCIEAGWLALLVGGGLLFQPISIRPFELPRVTFLLVVLPWMLVAAALAAPSPRSATRISIAAATVVGSYAISTASSIDPATSLWGSRFAAEGLLVGAAYAAVFAIVGLYTHHPGQVERLATVVLLASVPVTLYGFAQIAGADPLEALRVDALPEGRVISSFGSPILAGGYGAMVLPVTIGRLLAALGRASDSSLEVRPPLLAAACRGSLRVVIPTATLAAYLAAAAATPGLWFAAPLLVITFVAFAVLPPRSRVKPLAPHVELAGYAVLAALQTVLVIAARSRAGLAAAAVGVAVTIWLAPTALRISRRVRLVLLAGAAGAAVVGGDPATALRWVTRASSAEASAGQRWAIWTTTLELAAGHHQVGLEPDALAGARWLIGYGPETLAVAYEAAASAETHQLVPYRVSRAHSVPLDVLATRGALGIGAELFVGALLLQSVWRRRRDRGPPAATRAGLAGGLAAYVAAGLVSPGDPSLALPAWIFAGAVAAAVPHQPSRIESWPFAITAPRFRTAAVAALALASAALVTASATWGAVTSTLLWSCAIVALLTVGRMVAPDSSVSSPGIGRGRWLLAAVAVAVAAAVSSAGVRRLEAGLLSKLALQAEREGDLTDAISLARDATSVWPNDELYLANLAHVLVAAANAAPDAPMDQGQRDTTDDPLAPQGMAPTRMPKRALLRLAGEALEQSVAAAPLEYENRWNLEIVDRALDAMGEPGYAARALEQYRARVRLRPAGD